jgi:hypothetical protein
MEILQLLCSHRYPLANTTHNWTRSSQSQSHIATDGQSVCLSWCRGPAGAHEQMLLFKWKLLSCPGGAPSLTRDRVCHLSVIVDSISPLSLCTLIYNWVLKSSMHNTIKSPCQSKLSTADYALFPAVRAIISRYGTHRKHPVSNSNSIVACLFVTAGTCLPTRYPEMVVV